MMVPDQPAQNQGTAPRGLSSKRLSRLIFEAELPEHAIRALPAQSLYLAIQESGLASSAEIINAATLEQIQLFLDLDLWQGDQLNEDQLFAWLAITDAENDLSLLQKILKVLDLKLVGFLIGKYLRAEVFEEPTDIPPSPKYYTPDRGYTWIFLDIDDSDKHFLLARLLAFLFEANPDLFYQLLAIPSVSTGSSLEEEAFQERTKRLLAEGFPSAEDAAQLNSPLSQSDFQKVIAGAARPAISVEVRPVEPLIYDAQLTQPLAALLSDLKDRELFEAELTWLMNSALIRFGVATCDQEEVKVLAEKVKGAINVGLEAALKANRISAREIHERTGLKAIYRLGLSYILPLRAAAQKISDDRLRQLDSESETFLVVAGAREQFPALARAFRAGISSTLEASLPKGYQAIEHLAQVEAMSDYLCQVLSAA